MPIAPAGVTITRYGGGPVDQLLSVLAEGEATSATVTLPDGSSVTLIATSLEFVNRAFFAAFPNGFPRGTILFVRGLA